jgi:hypothetical protein
LRIFIALAVVIVLLALIAPPSWNATASNTVSTIPITAEDPNHPHAYAALALDPVNPMHLVGADIEGTLQPVTQNCVAYDSTDQGRTWSLAPIPYQGVFGSDPSIAIARDGTVYAACLGINRTSATTFRSIGVFVSRSTDGGRTFTNPILAVSSTDQTEIDKPYLAIDNSGGQYGGTLYLCYSAFDSLRIPSIYLAYSNDHGVTWHSSPITSNIGHECSLAVGPDGSVYVAYESFDPSTIMTDPTPSAEMIVRSTDGGRTFSQPTKIADLSPSQGVIDYYGSLAVDQSSLAHRGTIYAAFESGVENTGRTVLFTRSLDNGQTWSTPLRVSNAPTSVPSFLPWVSVAPDGRIDVAFADLRNTGPGGFDIYVASSTDGGLSFNGNMRLTPTSATWDGQRMDPGWPGDYLGLVSTNAQAIVLWTAMLTPASTAQLYLSTVSLINPTATPTNTPPSTALTGTATATVILPKPTATPKLSCKRGYQLVHHHCVKRHKQKVHCKRGYHLVHHRCIRRRKR